MSHKKIVEVQLHPWEQSFFCDPGDFVLSLGDPVVVQIEPDGYDLGRVVGFGHTTDEGVAEELKAILRIPSMSDLELIKTFATAKPSAFDSCRQLVRQHQLPMKIFDVSFSLDGRRMVFAFISSQRVDFRELVKDLSAQFKKIIRLQQIGSRDVIAEMGGIGPCGRQACCTTWLKELGNVSSDLIPLQQLEFRGSDRLSGLCGRLKCCLAYESEGYRLCGENMPVVGAIVKTKKYGTGRVVARNVIKHSISLHTEDKQTVEIMLGCKKVGCTGCVAGKKCATS